MYFSSDVGWSAKACQMAEEILYAEDAKMDLECRVNNKNYASNVNGTFKVSNFTGLGKSLVENLQLFNELDIPKLKIPVGVDDIPVSVTWIESPSDFWCFIVDGAENAAFDSAMALMIEDCVK